MKDSELRGLILQYFYDRRRQDILQAPKPSDLAADFGIDVDFNDQDILHVCEQLGEKGLFDWDPINSTSGSGDYFLNGIGKINAFGIDVVEGEAAPADIKVKFVQHNNNTVTITGSTNVNNMIGSNNTNTLTLPELVKAIESADATPQEKEEAKSLLLKVLEHPLVSKIAGSAVDLLGS